VGGSGCERIGNVFLNSLLDVDPQGYLYACGTYKDGGAFGNASVPGDGLWLAKLATSQVATETTEGEGARLRLHPNPAAVQATVALPEGARGRVVVYDLYGRRVADASADDRQTLALPVDRWAPGHYRVVFTDARDGRTAAGTLVVGR
jgi:hypothetical protein